MKTLTSSLYKSLIKEKEVMNKTKITSVINSDAKLCEANGMIPSEILANEKGDKSISFEILDFSDKEVNDEVVENSEDALTMVLLNESYTSNDESGYNYKSHFCFKSEDEAKAFVWFETIENSKDKGAKFFSNELAKNLVGCYISNNNENQDYQEAKFFNVKDGYLSPLAVKKEDLQKSAEQLYREIFLDLETKEEK